MRVRAVVPVYNEEALLPHFLRNYERFCDSIVVWDNGSTDRTREIARAHPLVELRDFWTDGYDEMSVLRALAQTKEESAGRFDWVLLPDCDELVLAQEAGAEREILSSAEGDVLAPTGYCLVQGPEEAPLDLGSGILAQRRFGYRDEEYSKPIVMRPEARIELCPGKHKVVDRGEASILAEPRFALIHCEMVDFDLWVYRKTRRPLSALNIQKGWSVRRFCRPRKFYEELWREKAAISTDLSKNASGLWEAP